MTYKGYVIHRTYDPWGIKLGHNFDYFKDEHVYGTSTLEEALQEIDERTGSYSWPVMTSEGTQNIYPFETLKDAIGFCDMFNAKPLFTFNAP